MPEVADVGSWGAAYRREGSTGGPAAPADVTMPANGASSPEFGEKATDGEERDSQSTDQSRQIESNHTNAASKSAKNVID